MRTQTKHFNHCDIFHLENKKSHCFQPLFFTPLKLSPQTSKSIKKSTILTTFVFSFALLVISFTLLSSIVSADELQVPAQFVMRIQPPGSNNDFLRPSDIFIDDNNGEVFVSDPGKNRILIFDSTGIFKFEFEGAEHFSSPNNVVVNSEGYIFVLGSSRDGRVVVKFDFDGLFIKEISLPKTIDGKSTEYSSMTIDEHGDLFLFDIKGLQICRFDSDGVLLHSFGILPQEDEKTRGEGIIYSFKVANDKIYVPISNLGMVKIYDYNGKVLQGIGIKGNNVGQLNFPVAVQVTESIIMVLDKHRINVVCFSLDGKFLGEFGGKGSSPGWFYHPTLLEVNNQNQVYVGQIFENKIQLCQIPEFILEKAGAKNLSDSATKGDNNVL